MPPTETANAPAPTASPAPAAMSDAALVDGLRAGNQRLFEPVMRRYNQRLFRVARGVLHDAAEAEDAVQDAYVKAFLKLDELKDTRRLGTWLARITRNEALMRLRRPDRRHQDTGGDDLETRIDESAMARTTPANESPEAETSRADLRRLLEDAIDTVPEPFRLAFILREVEQMSVAEAAEALEIEPATVKTRVFRAKRHLRRELSGRLESSLDEVFAFAGTRCDRIVAGVFKRLAGASRR